MSETYELIISEMTVRNTDREDRETPITVHIDNAGNNSGETVLIAQNTVSISITPKQWPYIQQAIDAMVHDIKTREKEQKQNEDVQRNCCCNS